MPGSNPAYHKIWKLEVSGGFLAGLKIDFDERLNCIIGGRGTGKTTVLQLLRWALVDTQARPRGDRKELLALLKENLKPSGQVRVTIETKDGERYVVERAGGPSAQGEVLDQEGRPAGFSLEHGAIFDVDIYAQNEIEGIANSPAEQLALIDRAIAPALRKVEERLQQLRVELEANAREIVGITDQQGALQESVRELPALRERLKAQQKAAKSETTQQVEREMGQKAARERERSAAEQAERFALSVRDALNELPRRIGDAPSVSSGPNREQLAPVAKAVDDLDEEVRRTLKQLAHRAERVAKEVHAARGDLQRAHADQDVRYREVLSKHEHDQGRANERLDLQKRIAELEDKERARSAQGESLTTLRKRRRELMRQLLDAREERFALRRAVAERWTRELRAAARKGAPPSAGAVKIEVSQSADPLPFAKLLEQAFDGGYRPRSVAEAIAGRIVPADLVDHVQRGDPDRLAEATGLPPARAGWVIGALKDKLVLYDLEIIDLPDVPSIELFDGKWKPASALSTGQRCTTILPILLLESDRPLLVDQPEDHLDNKFIFEAVVQQVRAIKGRRQLIFVTHNPNIPVLGDAEKVVVLESDGARAEAVAQDQVDVPAVKQYVETILEGGREAFEERARRYARRH